MDGGLIVTIMIFVTVQLLSILGIVTAVKGDARVLKSQLVSVFKELEKLGNVLVALAEQKGEMALVQERQLLQGKRLDELTARLNRHIDKDEEK